MTDQKYLPLVSPRSPSFARALARLDEDAGLMAEAAAVASVNRLVEAENDARESCLQIARDAQDEQLSTLSVDLAASHAERERLLGNLVKGLGGSPPEPGETRPILRHGSQFFEGMSNSHEVYTSLNEMYEELRSLYTEALSTVSLSEEVQEALRHLSPLSPLDS